MEQLMLQLSTEQSKEVREDDALKTICLGTNEERYSWHTLAAPVLLGMMLKLAALPPLQSLLEGPSTVFWVAEIDKSIYVNILRILITVQQFTNHSHGQQNLTSDGMNSGHQTLNNTKVVINDLEDEINHC
jgi:hypothetical protein